MKKFIRQLTIFSLIFIMTFGVGFSSQKGINVQAATTQTTTTNDGKLRKNGVLFTVVFSPNILDGKTGRVTATT